MGIGVIAGKLVLTLPDIGIVKVIPILRKFGSMPGLDEIRSFNPTPCLKAILVRVSSLMIVYKNGVGVCDGATVGVNFMSGSPVERVGVEVTYGVNGIWLVDVVNPGCWLKLFSLVLSRLHPLSTGSRMKPRIEKPRMIFKICFSIIRKIIHLLVGLATLC